MKNLKASPLLPIGLLLIFVLSSCGLFRQKEPNANFTVINSGCEAPCTVMFTNTSDNADTYEWDFGDGQTSSISSPEHYYETPGTYTITLTAFNESGSSTVSTPINITGDPVNPYYTFVLDRIDINAFPTMNGSQAWDPNESGSSQNPDIFYQVEDVTGAIFGTSPTNSNVSTTSLPSVFYFPTTQLTQRTVLHRLKFYDEDFNANELIGTVEFTPEDYPPSSGSNTVQFFLTGDGFTLTVDGFWQN